MNPVITLEGVSKSFRRVPVLRDVNLTVSPGESLAITGANGSGKSVLLRLMCGFLQPDTGTAIISPDYLSARAIFPSEFGVLIDRPGFIGHRTGLQNLTALAAIRKVADQRQVTEAMDRVGLDPSTPQPVQQYSLGMRQKLGLAQAFMENQRVLLLDEPFNALDEESRTVVHQILTEFHTEGRTIVFTSHNAEDIANLATRAVRIKNHTVASSAL